MKERIVALFRETEQAKINGSADSAEKRKLRKDLERGLKVLERQGVLTMTGLSLLRRAGNEPSAPPGHRIVEWQVVASNAMSGPAVGDTGERQPMGIASSEIPASEYQAVNPIYILFFGLLFTALWTFLATKKLDPGTPAKFGLGILQLGVGFGVFWWGAQNADARGMSSMLYLLVGWMLITTGELCLSPVGLSMVTKLAPTRMVSTVMGGWFLATAFSNLLAAVIATFTAVGHGAQGVQVVPPPRDTVNTYGDVLGLLALVAIGAALGCLALSPLLNRWIRPAALDQELGTR